MCIAGRFTRAVTLNALALIGISACHKASSPDEQVRTLVQQGELAVEARDVETVMQLVSPNFRDVNGSSRQELSRYLRGYFIAHQSIHLLTRIESIEFPSSDTATLKVGVASVTQAARDPLLAGSGADFLDFELSLARENGAWKVRFARWQ